MLDKMDDFLVDKVFQRAGDVLASRITVNTLAGVFFSGSAFVNFGQLYWEYTNSSLGFSNIFTIILIIWLCLRWAAAEKRTERAGLMPKERIGDMFLCKFLFVFFLVAIPMDVIVYLADKFDLDEAFASFGLLFEVMGLYFVACRNNPPNQTQQQTDFILARAGAS